MPDSTLEAFYDHGQIGDPMPADGGQSDELLSKFAAANIDVKALADELQAEGAKSFVDAWNDLMRRIEARKLIIEMKRIIEIDQVRGDLS